MGPLSHSTLIIVEAGASGAGLTGRVLGQADGESIPGFVARVRGAVAQDAGLQRVVLVAGGVHDFARIAARADIARTAAQCVAAGGGGSLVLASSDVRGELAQRALGEILREQLGSSVRVSIAAFDASAIAA